MKTCRRCKSEYPLEDFPVDRQSPDGHRIYCRACWRSIQRHWRANNIERARGLDRAQKQRERERKGPEQVRREWKHWYDNNIDHRRQYQQARNDTYKKRAHNAVLNALRRGKLTRPSVCSCCGKECRPDAHHADHSKPLEVIWLCRSCHVLVEQNE